MCPLCKQEGKHCPVEEREGRLVCGCGKHSWPDAAAFQETCRLLSLTISRTVHAWTQSL